MAASDDIRALLDASARQLEELVGAYEAALRSKQVSAALQVLVKNILENQRSALDHLAADLTRRFGNVGGRVYYPLAPEPSRFQASMDSRMPGVLAARPDVGAAIERHQPYSPGHAWLGRLVALTNENKHVQLTAQTRDETRWIETGRPGGAGVGFRPYQPGKGGVSFSGDFFINGVQIDPVTLQPATGGPKPYRETIYVDWLFEDAGDPVLTVLRAAQDGAEGVVGEVLAVAGL